MRRDTQAAFTWIIGILRKHKVHFQISGGFAARVYGATRELADIDIELHESSILAVLPDVQRHVVYGPKNYKDQNWNIILMTLRYKGQVIDIYGVDREWIFDSRAKRWIKERNDIRKAVRKRVFGLVVPVVAEEYLLRYKKELARRVDKTDVKQLTTPRARPRGALSKRSPSRG